MKTTEAIIETRRGSIKVVKYNKPRRKNAIDEEMYIRVKNILNSAATDDDISMIVLTGSGDFYSSGNDFSATAVRSPLESNLGTVLHDYIKAFITFPKLLVAIVNGPAIGIAATTLAMCDLVFASENVSFNFYAAVLHHSHQFKNTICSKSEKTLETYLLNFISLIFLCIRPFAPSCMYLGLKIM